MTDDPGAHSLACMEVWGGNEAVDSLVSVPGIDAHIVSRPHKGESCGGDIHYLSNCAAGIISRFILADVAGHGEAVGELARTLRRLMHKHINTADQSAFARALNREFAAATDSGRFATAILATYFAPTDHLIVCNAGHPRPLWFRAAERRWELLDGHSPDVLTTACDSLDLPLGVIEPTSYQQCALPLGSGDLVVFYTDALIESTGPGGTQLGETGLLSLAAGLFIQQPAEVIPALLARVAEFRGADAAEDDATVLALHHNAAAPPVFTLAKRAKAVWQSLGLPG